MRKISAVAVCLVLLGGAPGWSQETAQPPVPAATQQAPNEGAFLVKIYSLCLYRQASSRAAAEISQGDRIQSLAKKLIKAEKSATRKLADIARAEKMKLKGVMESEQADTLKALREKDGDDFNKSYLDGLIKSYEDSLSLLTSYSQSGGSQALKSYASEAFPELSQQLERVRQLAQGRSDG